MTRESIRILIVDDQILFREGLATLLSTRSEVVVAGEAANGEEAVRLTATLQPQVVLMDLRMPILDGVQATRRIREVLPNCQVLVLTTFDDDEYLFEALRAGAIGYLLKDIPSPKLVEAIQAAARGEFYLTPEVTAKVVNEFTRLAPRPMHPANSLEEPLTSREMEILRLVAVGDSNREISSKLFISEGTVKNHITNILGKLAVSGRAQAVLKARELGLL